MQPFTAPQRNWVIRASARDSSGRTLATATSAPFCRLAHESAQPAITGVTIKENMVHINGRPWIPWGAVYGHVPVYDGPAAPGKGPYRDLHNLPAWSMYDRFTSAPYTSQGNDFNCLRYVAGAVTPVKTLEDHWRKDNLYCSSAFVVPGIVWSPKELEAGAGGAAKLGAYLTFCKAAPMVVSVAPGIEEAFGNFHAASAAQLRGLEEVVTLLRRQTGKPVMVGHGGYWNRFEFEKVPFFDIYDPETEPLYPANAHTDFRPLFAEKGKVLWLRPQMYEDVPYERWRFHAYVELMRGCRGWQFAHGPGDPSLFRGLHGEMEFLKPIVATRDPGPTVTIEPPLEHWSRRHGGKLYVLAATTHGLTLGRWCWGEPAKGAAGRPRVTESASVLRDETNSYGIGQKDEAGPTIHGIQNLPNARAWPKGTHLVQWVYLDPKAPPRNLMVLVKADGRWTHAAAWGKGDVFTARGLPEFDYWFLNSFYRHAKGFLGWDRKLLSQARGYIPARSVAFGNLPTAGTWVKLDIPLEKIGAAGALLDGVGFLHEGGRVSWGRTTLRAPDGKEAVVWGDGVGLPPEQLQRTKIRVAGLAAGTKVRVLYEDREVTAGDGFFVDDFRGEDLYQRYGGGYGVGYGDAPVALHVYELPVR